MLSRHHYLKHKEEAAAFVRERVKFFSGLYNVSYNKISIKNQKTRWGSCSRKGNLNFNYKLFFLPQKLADYIVVHEICHLLEFNHSRKFWNLVEKTIPEYKKLKKELRQIIP